MTTPLVGLVAGLLLVAAPAYPQAHAQGRMNVDGSGAYVGATEAAQILGRCACLSNLANRPDLLPRPSGARAIVIPGSPTDGPFGELRSTPIEHWPPEVYVNGYGPVSPAGLERFAILSGALNSVSPAPAPAGRHSRRHARYD